MTTALAFIVVAAIATLLRATLTAAPTPGEIPWRTLVLNSFGAFCLALVLSGRWFDDPTIAATAGLGSLTTFSTVASETAALIDLGRRRIAALYVLLTIIAGVSAALIGISAGLT